MVAASSTARTVADFMLGVLTHRGVRWRRGVEKKRERRAEGSGHKTVYVSKTTN